MLILRLSKIEDQALIPISTILKFSALIQGYGITLKDKGGTLLETNTTIIAMKDCVDQLDAHLKLKQVGPLV